VKSNRWWIEGTLVACTNLRVGSGNITTRENLFVEERNGNVEVDVSAVAVDVDGRAYLPGTTIKGRLRSMAQRLQLQSLPGLFGSPDPKAKDAVGGKVTFFDAHLAALDALETAAAAQHLPHWSPQRQTAVAAGVTIHRQTRTAADQRLFHQEFVPPGTAFLLRFAGVEMLEEEVVDLLQLLNLFNSDQTVAGLGASVSDGWGRPRWKLTSLKTLDDDQLLAWVRESMGDGPSPAGWNALLKVPLAKQESLRALANARTVPDLPSAIVSTTIHLCFESNFLVNDPSKCKTKWKNSQEDPDDKRPNHTPRLTKDGHVLLPASSFRGALRSQAERILRTIGDASSACYPDSNGPRPACQPVTEKSDLQGLCPACKLFGAPGWRSPIHLTDFTPTADGQGVLMDRQEFVAIDRFTGGSAPHLKFNVTSHYRPTLEGKLSVDLARLATAGAGGWAIALLALVLRDLVEGDIRLGFGAAKGFGALHARIFPLQIPHWDSIPDLYTKNFPMEKLSLESLHWPGHTPDDLKLKIAEWVDDLTLILQKSQHNPTT
jgi:CRISPR/Cas system CSM-associated protein Csm3 (group 7 of RAMP superfamily)